MATRWTFRLLASLWMLLGLWAIWVGGSARAKAEIAQWLIADSWQRGVQSGVSLRPWPWADVRVTARLGVPALGEVRYVMGDDSGEALAFGPGFTAQPQFNEAMMSSPTGAVISGHRDTHFAFLKHVEQGMRIELLMVDGGILRYRVVRKSVVDSRVGRLPVGVTREDLLLVTCYPLENVVPGGPLRLVLIASPEHAV